MRGVVQFSLIAISENLGDIGITRTTTSTEFASSNNLPLFVKKGRSVCFMARLASWRECVSRVRPSVYDGEYGDCLLVVIDDVMDAESVDEHETDAA